MHKGFTLIELLVVVLIIGILSAVALPQYTKAVQRARVTELWSYCKALRDVQEVYYLANGKYTEDLANLDIQMPEIKDGVGSLTAYIYLITQTTGSGPTLSTIVVGSSARWSYRFNPTYVKDVSLYCTSSSFSCFDHSFSKKCAHLMPCSNPTISAGSSAGCSF